MKTLDRPVERISEASDAMGRKKSTPSTTSNTVHQMSIRVADDVYKRIERAAIALGLDATNLVRMMIMENLAAYERRAEQVK